MKKHPQVICIQAPSKPPGSILSSVSQYGPIEFLFNSECRPSLAPSTSMAIAIEFLKSGFSFEEDYILTGTKCDPAANWIALMALGAVAQEERLVDPTVTFLYIDSNANSVYPMKVQIPTLTRQ